MRGLLDAAGATGERQPGIEVAVEAANALRKPLVVFLGLTPVYPHANLRHYVFLAQGIPELARGLEERCAGFVLRRHPDHEVAKFCAEVRPSLVVGDENPLREPEQWRRTLELITRAAVDG